jgi:hypothetical protein
MAVCRGGHVVVAGLGMGVVVHFLLAHNRAVRKVTVVEKDSDVVSLREEGAEWFRAGERLKVIIGDAREVVIGERVDTLIVDIWPKLGSPAAEKDTVDIQARVQAGVVGCWGQELDLIRFVGTVENPGPGLAQAMKLRQEKLGFKVLGYGSEHYGALARQATLHFLQAKESSIVV